MRETIKTNSVGSLEESKESNGYTIIKILNIF